MPELYRVRAIAFGELHDLERAEKDARTALSIARVQGAVPLIGRAEETLRALSIGAHPVSSDVYFTRKQEA